MEQGNQGLAENANTAPCTACERRERTNRRRKTVYVGRDGWPVTGFVNKPVKTFIRRLILTKKKMNYGDWLDHGGCKIDFY